MTTARAGLVEPGRRCCRLAALLEIHEFIGFTGDAWSAAHALLALHHEIGDLLALELAGWAPGGQRWRLGAAFRAVLYEAKDTEELVDACRHPTTQRDPVAAPFALTAPVSASVGGRLESGIAFPPGVRRQPCPSAHVEPGGAVACAA